MNIINNSHGELKRLNEEVLQPGDIVLVTQRGGVSSTIRAFTLSDISHAMVYIEDRSVIDARPGGVRSANTQRLFFDADLPVYALRLRTPPSPAQLRTIEAELRSKIGARYSALEAVRAVLPGQRRASRKQFCSRLIAQAFAAAGIQLVARPNFCSPDKLKKSRLLAPLKNATVVAAPEEIAFFESRVDIPELMHEATNNLLDGARRFDPAIENLDDLNEHLVRHPEHDAALCRILKVSGYLEIWQIEKAKNPWQYDINLMHREHPKGMTGYCLDVLRNETSQPNRYQINRTGYHGFAQASGCRYFNMMAELYDTLEALHQLHVDTVQQWLAAQVSPSA